MVSNNFVSTDTTVYLIIGEINHRNGNNDGGEVSVTWRNDAGAVNKLTEVAQYIEWDTTNLNFILH
ncbi:MAG: hypothetical protein JJU02_09585 [Cryomorphaceae bacterium]|nr:hypothetical protein [Cryomorphaceae bacterium]